MTEQAPYMPTKAKSEEWGTPRSIFDPLNDEFGFTLDAAASDANHLCPRYMTKEEDGSLQSWENQIVFCNPPYNRLSLERFTIRAIIEAEKRGATSVFLVPAKTDQAWWHMLWGRRDGPDISVEFRFIRGRVKYVGADNSATFPSVIIIIRPA